LTLENVSLKDWIHRHNFRINNLRRWLQSWLHNRKLIIGIVSVDSKITQNNQMTFAPPIDGKRKLVDVGKHSACAVAAFLGTNTEDLDISAAMRRWVAANPEKEAHEAIQGLLGAAAGAWNRKGYPIDAMPLAAVRLLNGRRLCLIGPMIALPFPTWTLLLPCPVCENTEGKLRVMLVRGPGLIDAPESAQARMQSSGAKPAPLPPAEIGDGTADPRYLMRVRSDSPTR
jgi:hypothetical protein